VSRLFASVGVFIVITAPFLSMRLVAEEKRARTFELLLTAPVRPLEIVLGKYVAALAVLAVTIGIVALFPASLTLVARGASGGSAIEWQTVATGLLGLFLLGAESTAIGLFVSALTESVIVAALVSLIVPRLWVARYSPSVPRADARPAQGVSSSEHLMAFLQGGSAQGRPLLPLLRGAGPAHRPRHRGAGPGGEP
jgi:ABC-type Na+ efflux pump permease subunit